MLLELHVEVLTVDEHQLVLVDEVSQSEVHGREGEDERGDDAVGESDREDQEGLARPMRQ